MTKDNRLVVIQANAEKDRWEALAEACPTRLSGWGLNILRAGLDAHVGTIVVEPHYVCKDHRNLHSNFYSKKFQERSAGCTRVHFFTKPGITRSDLLLRLPDLENHYIGYSVIRPVAERSLGRTVIDPYLVGRHSRDGFFVLRTKFRTHINGPGIAAHGYPYMSQDGEATVCAHSALWGLCRYLSERYPIYPEVYPYDLIKMTTDTNGRAVPYRGMTYSDYSRILVNVRCHPEIISMKSQADDPALQPDKFLSLCAYVESGLPVLASYAGHVASIVGHTIDRTKIPPIDDSGLVDSSAFLKQFVVVDDNYFPYQLLGHRDDPENYSPRYQMEDIRVAVCPLPEKVYLPAAKARALFVSSLQTLLNKPDIAPMLRNGTNEPLVTRTLITTSAAFKRRKLEKAVVGGQLVDPFAVKIAELHLPHFIWLMEIAPLSHYHEGKCTGEIVLDATGNSLEEALLYARTGKILLLNKQRLTATNNTETLKTFTQYTHNLGEL